MNKQIEALKMAIEAMNDAGFFIDGDVGYPIFFEKAIKACKEALAEAALNEMARNAEELGLDYDLQKEWQSLSNDEIDNIWSMNFEFGFRACARAIEQASKEKNNEVNRV